MSTGHSEEAQRNRDSDPLRVCPHGCLFHARDSYCAWHGLPLERFVGKLVGNYRVQRPLSDGAFGAVYEVVNTITPDFVAAMKLLKPPYCYRPGMVDFFLKEAIATKGIQSVNIPAMYDVHRTPWPYINMALVEGETLHGMLRKRTRVVAGSSEAGLLPIAEAKKILTGVARAMAKSHKRGVIHRDLKPHNVMVMSDTSLPLEDRIQVVDWGISLSLAKRYSSGCHARDQNAGRRQEIVGTFPYMAPEAFGGRYFPQTDVYSFGVMAYEILTGKKPFTLQNRETPAAWKNLHSGAPPNTARQLRRDVPRRLDRLVHRCLATDHQKRYSDGAALLKALERGGALRRVAAMLPLLALGLVVVSMLRPWDVLPLSPDRTETQPGPGTALEKPLGETSEAAIDPERDFHYTIRMAGTGAGDGGGERFVGGCTPEESSLTAEENVVAYRIPVNARPESIRIRYVGESERCALKMLSPEARRADPKEWTYEAPVRMRRDSEGRWTGECTFDLETSSRRRYTIRFGLPMDRDCPAELPLSVEPEPATGPRVLGSDSGWVFISPGASESVVLSGEWHGALSAVALEMSEPRTVTRLGDEPRWSFTLSPEDLRSCLMKLRGPGTPSGVGTRLPVSEGVVPLRIRLTDRYGNERCFQYSIVVLSKYWRDEVPTISDLAGRPLDDAVITTNWLMDVRVSSPVGLASVRVEEDGHEVLLEGAPAPASFDWRKARRGDLPSFSEVYPLNGHLKVGTGMVRMRIRATDLLDRVTVVEFVMRNAEGSADEPRAAAARDSGI